MFEELMVEITEKMVLVDEKIGRIVPVEKEPRILYEASNHIIRAGGKRVRPFIVMKSCEMCGGSETIALSTAAAVELLHTFTLVHDDIMDRSATRRGVRTVHEVWGIPIAIAAGDCLFAKVYEALVKHTPPGDVSSDRLLQVVDALTSVTIEICEGQALDLSYESRRSISESECLTMIQKKSAALFEASAKSGGIIGGANPSEIEKMGSFGLRSGIAFQITDDILGLTASEDTLGKPVGDDLREGKKTLIVVHALQKAEEKQRKIILDVLGRAEASDEQIHEAIDVIKDMGSIEYSRVRAEELVSLAKKELDPFPDSRAKKALTELADFFVARSF